MFTNKQARKFKVPVQRWFEYHCLESEDSSDFELWHRTHQQVQVTGLEVSDEVPVLSVLFADGFQGSAWIDELSKTTKDWYRPDYSKDTP